MNLYVKASQNKRNFNDTILTEKKSLRKLKKINSVSTHYVLVPKFSTSTVLNQFCTSTGTKCQH